MSRYRRLRGFALHVLPLIRARGMPDSRVALRWTDFTKERRTGYCVWCRLPVDTKGGRYWDADCERQLQVVLGRRVSPRGTDPRKEVSCPECGETGWRKDRMEIDHLYPIARAKLEGPKAVVRAFLIENLRWLCIACHRRKTADEARWRAALRRETESHRPKPRPLPEELMAPMLDFSEFD